MVATSRNTGATQTERRPWPEPPLAREQVPAKKCFARESVAARRERLQAQGIQGRDLVDLGHARFVGAIDPEGKVIQFTTR
ncbi:MAG: hypothetical protein OEZ06_13280 [Myxococcales bacterium]|nr:hypothetical protein [Myxococcales bacterium]